MWEVSSRGQNGNSCWWEIWTYCLVM